MTWLVGSRGMLGTEVHGLLEARGSAFLATDAEVDITLPGAPAAFLASRGIERLDWIVNCAAYTAVDAAEYEPARALAVNATGVENLCAAAKRTGASLLHVSTDYVFDGSKDGEYGEEEPPHPLGVYGESKLRGEVAIAAALERFVIVRTAWLHGRHGKNFVDTMLRLFRERGGARVVDDQWGNPTWARDLAKAILAIVARGCPPAGVFHFCGAGRTSWFGFAQEIRAQAVARGMVDATVRVDPITTAEYPTRARRPANSALCTRKFETTYGFAPRDWKRALAERLDEEAS